MMDAFAAGKVAAVCLHPRAGLEMPYGGTDWFDLIQWVCEQCALRDIDVWLYDEDPYPSGAAGGRIFFDHPEFVGHYIESHFAADSIREGDNFCFPPGRLLWAGWVREGADETIDLTARVGVMRRNWAVLDPWDSRYYYPETPRYNCPRAMPTTQELALRVPSRPEGMRLAAFVARPVHVVPEEAPWTAMPDWLNPDCTREFIRATHERYLATVGPLFGKQIQAIFSDEPKFQHAFPFTPGLFDLFRKQVGYDLRPRLHHLFAGPENDLVATTRIDYRRWCAQRFEEAWVRPVSSWVRDHDLKWVGHISPEDDLIQQSDLVGDLLPIMKQFHLPGIDLIIPATGDNDHGLINIGVTSAISVAQQTSREGVLSETLGVSGRNGQVPIGVPRRVLLWQALMGVTTHVIHCAYTSQEGNRAIDAPPDFGPLSDLWEPMQQLAVEVDRVQSIVRHATQTAPVAILWPIRTFNMLQLDWQNDPTGLRRRITNLLVGLLDRQVGVHFLDESALHDAAIENGTVKLGRASYSHILVASSHVIHQKTVDQLRLFQRSGGELACVDFAPDRVQASRGVEPLLAPWLPVTTLDRAIQSAPRLFDVEGDTTNQRCTVWTRDGRTTALWMSLSKEPAKLQVNGHTLKLFPDTLCVLEEESTLAAVGPGADAITK